ncbi:MAG: magnesium transporter [Hyphomicrobiales bacterium]|nr:magnesium transporter [Hyphomicrobiales bacterium]
MTEQTAPTETTAAESLRDEDGALRPHFVEAVETAIFAGDAQRLRELAGELHEADLGDLVEALAPESRPKLVELMGGDFDFAALNEVPDAVRDEILEELPTETVAEGVSELESDDAVAILEDLDREEQAEILEAMPAPERRALQRSLDYPEKSAGRLMQTTFVGAPPTWTAGQTLDHLREGDQDALPDSFFEVFVVEPDRKFLGTVFLDVLARARRSAPLSDIMLADRRRVRVDEDEEEVARMFERYNLVSTPVVDANDRLVGVITIDDIVDVIQEAADEDIKALGGVSRREEIADPVLAIARSRFVWLFVNLITAFLASSVLGLFQGSLQKMVALAILAPIVASQGGQAATQTMTVAVRALATKELSRSNALWIIFREFLVGLLNGLAFGVVTGLAAAAWFGIGALGFLIAAAMLTNMIAAAFGGILVPLALEKLGVDPAVSSGAFVTTVTDVVGYFSFLSFATLYFGLR